MPVRRRRKTWEGRKSRDRMHLAVEVGHDFAATSRSSPQAKVVSRSGSGPNLNRRPVISEAITRT